MFKITGVDKLQRQLEEAEAAFSQLEGDIGTVSFDPSDPMSIETAIKHMEKLIDDRLGKFSNNAIIGPLIEGMKEQYRAGILEKAAEARLAEKK